MLLETPKTQGGQGALENPKGVYRLDLPGILKIPSMLVMLRQLAEAEAHVFSCRIAFAMARRVQSWDPLLAGVPRIRTQVLW